MREGQHRGGGDAEPEATPDPWDAELSRMSGGWEWGGWGGQGGMKGRLLGVGLRLPKKSWRPNSQDPQMDT